MARKQHCCELMELFLHKEHIPLYYSPILREYVIDKVDIAESKEIEQNIFYCPWCAGKLPVSLRREFFNILEEEYDIEPHVDILKNENLPEEFQSDAWWKKRGL